MLIRIRATPTTGTIVTSYWVVYRAVKLANRFGRESGIGLRWEGFPHLHSGTPEYPLFSTRPNRKSGCLVRWRDAIETWTRRRRFPKPSVARPRVGVLEPRLVLNATAELSLLGELLITGTDAPESVRLDVDDFGGIGLFDQNDQVIPIAGHPGDPATPLDSARVTSGVIRFDLRGGDDSLQLKLPSNLSVTVIDGDGTDRVDIASTESGLVRPRTFDIASESIAFDSGLRSPDLRDASLNLAGDVFVGASDDATNIDTVGGKISIDGRLVVAGDVTLLSRSTIDVGEATLTASAPFSNLAVSPIGGAALLGSADASGGHAIEEVAIGSASGILLGSVNGTDSFVIDGELVTGDIAGEIEINAAVEAGSVDLVGNSNVTIDSSVRSLGGPIRVIAGDTLSVAGDVAVEPSGDFGSIELISNDIQLRNADLITNGGDIVVDGPVTIDGGVRIDSGNGQTSNFAGRIEFTQSINSLDQSGDTLRLDARGGQISSHVRLDGDVGPTNPLNGLSIFAVSVETQSIAVTGGDVLIVAPAIAVGSQTITRQSGNIVFDGTLELSPGTTYVEAADDVRFAGQVLGDSFNSDLNVTAGGNVAIEMLVDSVRAVDIDAGEEVNVDAAVTTSERLQITADRIGISDDIDTTARNGVDGGDVLLNSVTGLLIDNDAIIEVGIGSIIADGGGGGIDVADASLRSRSGGDAITLANANRVRLGDVQALAGTLTLGDDRPITGLIDQANGTMAQVQSLVTNNSAELNLSAENDIAIVQRVVSTGPVTIRDAVDDLSIAELIAIDQAVSVDAGGDVEIRRLDAGADGDVSIVADDDIFDAADAVVAVTADQLVLVSANTSPMDGSPEGIDLSTDVNRLVAEVNGTLPGDLRIDEAGDITLAVNEVMPDGILQTTNGQIVVRAGGKILVTDDGVSPDDGDPELIARGDNGRIELVAGMEIEFADGVRLAASKQTAVFFDPETTLGQTDPIVIPIADDQRAVLIDAPAVTLAADITIDTGPGQGVARFFGPRPAAIDEVPVDGVESTELAFFDPSSVTVNVLTQALLNDATGILGVNIGQPGERGLAVEFDWGAPTRRFQLLRGLSADQNTTVGVTRDGVPLNPVTAAGDGRLVVEHFYTEGADILDSTFNGRTAATEPLNVRFAVRHHESILVRGDTVTQSTAILDRITQAVPGGILSTTDNAESEAATLDSGRISFVIPNLTVPFAFIPVRDVIPEFETPTFTVRAETTVFTSQSTVDAIESTSSSLVSREEFFRLRVLSPDPDGDDLAEPKKLPDDILDGDKIQRLFAALPDGAYEIEYVLGDGNERSILRVDVRDGEATIVGEPLDEGELKLKRLDDDKSNSDRLLEDAPELL